jgi:hypothetical protein
MGEKNTSIILLCGCHQCSDIIDRKYAKSGCLMLLYMSLCVWADRAHGLEQRRPDAPLHTLHQEQGLQAVQVHVLYSYIDTHIDIRTHTYIYMFVSITRGMSSVFDRKGRAKARDLIGCYACWCVSYQAACVCAGHVVGGLRPQLPPLPPLHGQQVAHSSVGCDFV